MYENSNFNRVRLGKGNAHVQDCLNGNFIGADVGIAIDLNGQLPDDWKEFNRKFIPVYLQENPSRTKLVAGQYCGMLWTLCKGYKDDDIVLCPDGSDAYYVGKIIGPYEYHAGKILPHRRPVTWLSDKIDKSKMSEGLQKSLVGGTRLRNLNKHREEILSLMNPSSGPQITVSDETVEDPYSFALEKHLEDFLVENWDGTALAKNYKIVEEDGEPIGRGYLTDTGPMDILAISKDEKEFLVIELKRGKASDVVVGQIQRYMGYIKSEIAEQGQSVKGCIIALEDDLRIRHALSVTNNIDFYTYEVGFTLNKA